VQIQRPAATPTYTAAPAVAILPFGIKDAALQTWRNGALVLLATDIDGVAGLRAIDLQTILAALPPQPAGDSSLVVSAPDQALTIELARRTDARYALAGNAVVIGSTVRLSADLYRTANGRRLRHFQFEGAPDRMFALLDALAVDVLRTLLRLERMAVDASRLDLAQKKTTSLVAIRAYLEGEAHSQLSRFTEAAESYARALDADSMFALALARFFVPYSFVQAPQSVPAALARALRMLDRLPRREALLVQASDELVRGNEPEGFELLRQVSREYPDDSEVWYSLGEVAFHEGGDLLLQPDVALGAFSKAVQLNPAFVPPYYHLVELLIGQRADSAGAAAANSAYERYLPEGETRSVVGLAVVLAFGNSATRDAALAVLDTSAFGAVEEVSGFLAHRAFGPRRSARSRCSRRGLNSRPSRITTSVAAPAGVPSCTAASSAPRLQPRSSTTTARRSRSTGRTCWESHSFLKLRTLRCRLARRRLRNVRALASSSRERMLQTRHSGANSKMHKLLRVLADSSGLAGDPANAAWLRLHAEALRGYGLARAGNLDTAIQVLVAIQPRLSSSGNKIVRWWLGNFLLQANRPLEARKYFASFWDWQHGHPIPASFYLARIDDQLGNRADARAKYARFVRAWRNADRDVQPRVAEARMRLAALAR
jgi:tetratricopeptide (TPR) repeat protein